MHKGRQRLLSLCICGTLLAGCSTASKIPFFQGPYFTPTDPNQTVEGPRPIVHDAFEEIDLVCLLYQKNAGTCGNSQQSTSLLSGPSTVLKDYQKNLQGAFLDFYKNSPSGVDRNRVQDHIISASNQRCGQYKQFLKRHDITTNLALGSLATITAGAGAIFTASDTVRALSGIAAMFSGLRAESNEVFYQRRTIQVLTNGFEAKRKEIYSQILEERANKGVSEYSVERAIGDAVVYHDHCSLIAGLEHAALSIERLENPGIKQLKRTLGELEETQLAMGGVVAASAGAIAPGVLLVVEAFDTAKSVRDQLEGKRKELKDKGQLDPNKAGSDGLKTKVNGLNKKQETLIAEMDALITESDTKVLTEANKTKAQEIENALQQSTTEVYSAASNDAAARNAALAKLNTKRDEARDAISAYNTLRDKIQVQISRAEDLLRRMTEVEQELT